MASATAAPYLIYHRRMWRRWVGTIAVCGALVACSSNNADEPPAATVPTNPTLNTSPSVPPTIDAAALRESPAPVTLPQLVGLSEAQARRWASDSGFNLVVRADELTPGVLIPSERIIVTLAGGVVTQAAAG